MITLAFILPDPFTKSTEYNDQTKLFWRKFGRWEFSAAQWRYSNFAWFVLDTNRLSDAEAIFLFRAGFWKWDAEVKFASL